MNILCKLAPGGTFTGEGERTVGTSFGVGSELFGCAASNSNRPREGRCSGVIFGADTNVCKSILGIALSCTCFALESNAWRDISIGVSTCMSLAWSFYIYSCYRCARVRALAWREPKGRVTMLMKEEDRMPRGWSIIFFIDRATPSPNKNPAEY